MQKKFFGNLFFLILLNLLVKPFWILGIDRAVQNTLGHEVYGEYFALLNFSFLLNIVLDLGITNYNNRNLAQNQHLFNKYLGKLLSMKAMLGLLYFVLTTVVAFIVGYNSNQWQILGILMLNQFLVSLILFLRSNFSALFFFKTDSVISVLDRLLLILFCGILLLYQEGAMLSLKYFVLAQTAAYAMVALVCLVLLFRIKDKVRQRFNWGYSYVIFRQSLPFALLVLLMTIYTRTDSVMLERMLPDGKASSGIYAQSYRILESLNMIAFLFSTLLLPIFSNMLKKGENVQGIINGASKLLALFSVSAFIIISVFNNELMHWMYTDVNEEGVLVLKALIICILPISGTYIYGTLLTANGSLKALNIMAVVGVLINILLNAILIPEIGVLGAALATVFTQSVTFLIQYYLSKRLVVDPNYRVTFSVLSYLCLGGTAVYLLHDFLSVELAIVFSTLVLAIMALLLKLFDWQYLKELLRSRG